MSTWEGVARKLTYLDKCIILLIIALNSQNRVPWTACTDAHLDHLTIKEVGKILFVNIWSDTADVETTRLARKVRVSTYTHSETLNWHRRRQACNTQNRRDLCTVGTRKIEQACEPASEHSRSRRPKSYLSVWLAVQYTAHTQAHGHPTLKLFFYAETRGRHPQE